MWHNPSHMACESSDSQSGTFPIKDGMGSALLQSTQTLVHTLLQAHTDSTNEVQGTVCQAA